MQLPKIFGISILAFATGSIAECLVSGNRFEDCCWGTDDGNSACKRHTGTGVCNDDDLNFCKNIGANGEVVTGTGLTCW
ncbi:hypothetical protein INS49_011815 [Diaporthe citri]|uniref:uncharacterized protein n=1 Tax=Diaporthe citri TaxID=83186 RepID=UPI001C8046AF|nr:uncharacterized protein INS49_011815 [Diaporthe citri]KAG6360749.1 hypothetical protein INS49_011815 [Diaporthe citri]